MKTNNHQNLSDPDEINRRGFLAQMGKVAGGVALFAVTPRLLNPEPVAGQPANGSSPPNILIILVDQWRSPIWFPDFTTLAELLPNTSSLFSQSVNFTNYFPAATACGAVYEEAIHVPFYVRNFGNADAGATRKQLCSSVDVIGFLLSLATGGETWRTQYPYLANRARMGQILQDPTVAGRDYVLTTTDEPFVPETRSGDPYDADIPLHVIGYRTTAGKLGLYSFWKDGTIDIATKGRELEFYDYSTPEGIIETKSTPDQDLATEYYDALSQDVIPNELRQSLPASLQPYQQQAIQTYMAYLKELEKK